MSAPESHTSTDQALSSLMGAVGGNPEASRLESAHIAPPRDWKAVQAAIDDYLEGYELRLDEGCYTPQEFERFLLVDAIAGLMEDDEFIDALYTAVTAARAVPAAGEARDADMYWNDADTEGFAGSTLDDAVRYVADDIPTSEMPVTLTFQVAKTLPNVQVLVTGVDSEGDLQYEVIDAAIAAQQGKEEGA